MPHDALRGNRGRHAVAVMDALPAGEQERETDEIIVTIDAALNGSPAVPDHAEAMRARCEEIARERLSMAENEKQRSFYHSQVVLYWDGQHNAADAIADAIAAGLLYLPRSTRMSFASHPCGSLGSATP